MMIFLRVNFLQLLFLSLNFLPAYGMQDDNKDTIEWYESFFQGNQNQSIDKVLSQSESKLRQAIASQHHAEEASARKELGLIHLTRINDYEKAMDFFIRCLELEDSLHLRHNQIFTYIAIAQVFEDVGHYYKSAEFLSHALVINKSFKDIYILVFIHNKLGKINALLGRIDESFENYQLVLKYEDQIEDPKIEAEALFNLAHLYTLQGKYEEALQKHKQSLAIRRSIHNRKNEAQSLNDIGELYRLMKNEDKALANHVVALEIRQALADKKDISESFNNIGVLYYRQANFQRAIDNLQLALENAQASQSKEQIRKSYEFLSLCLQALGDYEEALKYKDRFLAMNDFIQRDISDRKLLETQSRYMIDRKELQIEKLESIRIEKEQELRAEKQLRNFLFMFIGLSLVIAVLILYLYILKRKSNRVLQAAHTRVNQQNEELQELNATKNKFFSIISHDLKGPLNSLTSFSGLLINHTDSLSKEEIRMLAQDLDKSVKNLFALLENLLEWSRSQTGAIEFKPERFDLTTLLESNKELLRIQAHNKKIVIEYVNKGPLLVGAHKHSVNTVVRNLIANAIKFTPEGGCITLDAHASKDVVIVSVADTGIGMSKDVIEKLFRIDTKYSTKGTADEKGTGLGLILCKEFIEKNGGRIWVQSEAGKGSVFYFTLPLN
jgi:signal transduction histidine kinase